MTEKQLTSNLSKVSEIWVTSPGVIFILENMPAGVEYFSADTNSTLKTDILILSIQKNIGIKVIYNDDGSSTREAQEIRLALGV